MDLTGQSGFNLNDNPNISYRTEGPIRRIRRHLLELIGQISFWRRPWSWLDGLAEIPQRPLLDCISAEEEGECENKYCLVMSVGLFIMLYGRGRRFAGGRSIPMPDVKATDTCAEVSSMVYFYVGIVRWLL